MTRPAQSTPVSHAPISIPGVLIRPARADDFDQIANITNHYILTTAIHFATEPVSAETLRDTWAATRERYPFLVADSAARGQPAIVLGYAKAGVWRERAAYSWTPECGVYVRAGQHRQGVGRAMYARLFDIMARQGFRSVIAGATLPNQASVRLHESMGFIEQGIMRQAGWKLGQWWDVRFWQKPLGDPSAPARPLRPVSEVVAEIESGS